MKFYILIFVGVELEQRSVQVQCTKYSDVNDPRTIIWGIKASVLSKQCNQSLKKLNSKTNTNVWQIQCFYALFLKNNLGFSFGRLPAHFKR